MSEFRRGRLITLEGGEGAGKSSHVALVVRWLESQRRSVVKTREPGGSPQAEAIRQVVLADWAEGTDDCTETLLMFAARSAHVNTLIRPALAAGQDVVCDRFVDATWAYQGAGRGVPEAHLVALQDMVLGKLLPDLTLLFDIDPIIGLARARHRGDVNRFEDENSVFANAVRQAYLKRAAAESERFAVIDASQNLDQVRLQVLHTLEERLK